MATVTDTTGIRTISPTITDVIVLSDLQDVLAYYNQHVTVAYTPPTQRQRITTVEWTNLRTAILTAFNTATAATGIVYDLTKLPTFSSGRITGTLWPSPKSMFVSMEKEYTAPGVTTFTIPDGCQSILVEWLIAGGGGGGSATEVENGGGGGGGGSGGYYANMSFNATAGQVLVITIGGGGSRGANWYNQFGGSGGTGGSSSLTLNGSVLLSASGGQGGVNGYKWQGGAGGAGGSPNGGWGGGGQTGDGGRASGVGGSGADGPFGGHGAPGWIGQWGGDGSAYGAGGGGAGFRDRTDPNYWWGGFGAGGYAKIKYLSTPASS